MCDSDKANSSAQQKPNTACDASTTGCATKISKCVVQFRPKDDWKGEYGFDWLRIAGAGEKAGEVAYKGLITGGYKGGGGAEYTSAEAYTALKSEFGSVATEIKSSPEDLKEYFTPYLNLFPKNTAGTPTPPFEAELKIVIAVEENAPDKIELEFDNALLNLSKNTLSDKAVGAKRVSSDIVKITCAAELPSDQEIKVWSFFEGAKTLSGMLKISANNPANRKELKLVFANVRTNINGVAKIGSISAGETLHLKHSLFQALIIGNVENGPDLDLRTDNNFKIVTNAGGVKQYGKFIYKSTGVGDTNIDGGLYEDYPSSEMFKYIRNKYLNTAGNEKYKTGNYFTVFSFDEVTYDPVTMGQIQGVGTQNLVLFYDSNHAGGKRDDGIISHEALHGLGLYHAHSDGGTLEADRKYVYQKKKTDNIMSYNFAELISTWHWQWEIMKRNL